MQSESRTVSYQPNYKALITNVKRKITRLKLPKIGNNLPTINYLNEKINKVLIYNSNTITQLGK